MALRHHDPMAALIESELATSQPALQARYERVKRDRGHKNKPCR